MPERGTIVLLQQFPTKAEGYSCHSTDLFGIASKPTIEHIYATLDGLQHSLWGFSLIRNKTGGVAY